ncbi:protein MAINTENANCE OF MERISTEMS [Trifolium repens]|nr:protein MAINTENANCE OF MERISTEMS [Trifolium repens]
MEEEVGRKRLGRESVAHSSARRERAKNRAVPPTRARGRMKEVSSTAENHPEPVAEHDFEVHSEANPLGDNAMEEVEENEENEEVEEREDGDYVEEAEEDEHGEEEEEEEEPTPPPKRKPRKRKPPTTQGRQNPPQDAPAGGYPGGPTDLSLLPSFGKHVANALWKGQLKERYLRCQNNGKKVLDFDLPSSTLDWFWKVVNASGLRPLLKTNYPYVDWGLLTAFTERWQPETGTFHLPVGEMTITLDDVSCLLHIPISGKMLNHEGTCCKFDEGADMCEQYLNFDKDDAKTEFEKTNGAHIGFPKLLQLYLDNLNLAEKADLDEEATEEDKEFYKDCTLRCFFLYLLGSTLFTNKSSQYVDVIFLTYLQDLDVVNTWNWGASALAYLFKYLEKSTRIPSGNHGGYNCLFQAWIMLHFPRFGAKYVHTKYNHRDPLAAKFYCMKGTQLPDEHRTVLDRMDMDEVVWQPYEDHRHVRPFQDCAWYSGWIMCGTAMICPHLPERVLRQYGHVQSIPRAPYVSAKAKMNRFTNDQAFQKYIWPPMEGSPPRPANIEVIIEEDNANQKMDVFEICRKVRSEVTQKLDGELTLEEAREILKKVCDDLEPVTTYSVRR